MTKKEWQDLMQDWVTSPFTSKLPNTRERHRTPWFNTKNRRWYLWNEGLKKWMPSKTLSQFTPKRKVDKNAAFLTMPL